jgi:hypothetical protein
MGGLPELKEKQATGTSKLTPKSRDQVVSELNYLREQLGLDKTGSDMKSTRAVLERIGSFSSHREENR